MMDHRYHRVKWGVAEPRLLTSEANWKKPVTWNRKAATTGKRIKVFCASLADVFDVGAPQEWRERLWRLIADTPNLDWLLLTKRPENFMFLPWAADGLPFPNVWLGVSAENEIEARTRIPLLRAWNAAIKFVSAEPLLGDISMVDFSGIDWIIPGGESGNGARPMQTEWVRSLIRAAERAGAQIWVKQMGELWATENRAELIQIEPNSKWSKHGADPAFWEPDLRQQHDPVKRLVKVSR
jgi:protein gp37